TRWPRDWSSDVCSSDLVIRLEIFRGRPVNGVIPFTRFTNPDRGVETFSVIEIGLDAFEFRGVVPTIIMELIDEIFIERLGEHRRSEERRVGKECRTCGW